MKNKKKTIKKKSFYFEDYTESEISESAANLNLTQISLNQERGKGIELRLHGCDPDKARENAKRLGFSILAEVNDKNHGLREVYILDQDGYVWVPDIPISKKSSNVGGI